MFKNFLLQTILKSQLKDVPQEQQDFILSVVEKNPDLFMKIAQEVQTKTKGGEGQQEAMVAVMQKYQNELKNAIGK